MQFPWYEVVDNNAEIAQGDIIKNCPVVFFKETNFENESEIKAEIKTLDVIVMSQACDLAQMKVKHVILCGLYSVKELEPAIQKKLVEIVKGREPAHCIINEFENENISNDFHLVDFRNIYSLPINNLLEIAKNQEKRLRLLPPYREHLSQAFASYFMRIGLPIDINRERLSAACK